MKIRVPRSLVGRNAYGKARPSAAEHLLRQDIVVYVSRTNVANISTFVDQYITRGMPFNHWYFCYVLGLTN